MIVNDQRSAILIATSALAFGLFTSLTAPAAALETNVVSPRASASNESASQPTVSTVRDGVDLRYATKARTFGEFISEHPVELTAAEPVAPDAGDVAPSPVTPLARVATPGAVRPTKTFVAWTTHRTVRVPAKLQNRTDARLAAGTTRVVDAGRPGLRVITYRFVRHGDAKPVRTTLASRIVRMPRARVIVHGVATYASLARVAEQGFQSAMHVAGSAIHMIATAYTAGCSGCSGITASGVRAGFGVIAVDPRVIPLGTRLFIPGYGRAVAGDTGGAILGHRVDLGMNSQNEALQYGRRPVTVYVLR